MPFILRFIWTLYTISAGNSLFINAKASNICYATITNHSEAIYCNETKTIEYRLSYVINANFEITSIESKHLIASNDDKGSCFKENVRMKRSINQNRFVGHFSDNCHILQEYETKNEYTRFDVSYVHSFVIYGQGANLSCTKDTNSIETWKKVDVGKDSCRIMKALPFPTAGPTTDQLNLTPKKAPLGLVLLPVFLSISFIFVVMWAAHRMVNMDV